MSIATGADVPGFSGESGLYVELANWPDLDTAQRAHERAAALLRDGADLLTISQAIAPTVNDA